MLKVPVLLLMFSNLLTAYSQQNSLEQSQQKLTLEIISVEADSNRTFGGFPFTFKITNYSNKIISLPNRYIIGPLKYWWPNLGFELFYCNSDTIDITYQWAADIAIREPPQNTVNLLPGKDTVISSSLDRIYFSQKGNYKIRAILKKRWRNNNIAEIDGDVYSDWKMIQLDFLPKLSTRH